MQGESFSNTQSPETVEIEEVGELQNDLGGSGNTKVSLQTV